VWVRVADGERLRRPEICSEEAWAKFFTPCFASATARPKFSALVAKLSKSLGENIHAATVRLLTLSAASMSRTQDWRGTGSTGGSSTSLLSNGGSASGLSGVSTSGGSGFSLSTQASISRLTGAVVSHEYAYSSTDSGHGGSAQTLDLGSMRGAGSEVSISSRMSVSKMTGEMVSHDYAYSHPANETGDADSGSDAISAPTLADSVAQGMRTVASNTTVISEMDLDLELFRLQSNRVSPAGGFPEPVRLVTQTPVVTLVPTSPSGRKTKRPAETPGDADRRHTIFLEPVDEPRRTGSAPGSVPVTTCTIDSDDDLVAVVV
jgi:hypothetical protein